VSILHAGNFCALSFVSRDQFEWLRKVKGVQEHILHWVWLMEASRSFPWVSLSFRELVRRSCFYKMLVDKRSIPGEPVKRGFQQHIRAALSPPTSSPNSDSDSPPPLPPETPPPPPEKPTLPALDDAITSAESELLAGNPEKDKPWFVLSEATLVPLCACRDTAQLSYYNNRSETNRLVIPPRWTS